MPRVAAAQYSRAMRDPENVVDPIDRKVHDILVHIMETTTNEGRRQRARDLRFTLPSVKHPGLTRHCGRRTNGSCPIRD